MSQRANSILERLQALKERVNKAQTEIANLEGQETVLMKGLEELGIIALGEAGPALTKLEDNISELEDELNTRLEEAEQLINETEGE